MRVYEWGVEHDPKVILVHGDTTLGPMFGPIAEMLVRKRLRIMVIGALMASSTP